MSLFASGVTVLKPRPKRHTKRPKYRLYIFLILHIYTLFIVSQLHMSCDYFKSNHNYVIRILFSCSKSKLAGLRVEDGTKALRLQKPMETFWLFSASSSFKCASP